MQTFLIQNGDGRTLYILFKRFAERRNRGLSLLFPRPSNQPRKISHFPNAMVFYRYVLAVRKMAPLAIKDSYARHRAFVSLLPLLYDSIGEVREIKSKKTGYPADRYGGA